MNFILCLSLLLILSSAFGNRVSSQVLPIECGAYDLNGQDLSGSYREKETSPGQYPWVIAVLDHRDSLNRYIGGGSLISFSVVLTGVEALSDAGEADLLVRAGEWNVSTTSESYPHVDRQVKRIVRHEQFNKETGDNDLALLFLTAPFSAQPNIRPICLAEENSVFGGCFYNGWGMEQTTSIEYPSVLKKVPINVKNNLNSRYISDYLILGQASKRSIGCKGDSGSPLVCPVPRNPNRFRQVGILICGRDGRPGVFTNVAKFHPWITRQLEEIGQNY